MNPKRFCLPRIGVLLAFWVVSNEALAQNLTVDLHTLPAGASVTIAFEVRVDDPLPLEITQISSQAAISGSNFTAVLSDDPDTPAPNDPTVTDVYQLPVAICQNVTRVAQDGDVASVTPEAADNGSFDPDGGEVTYAIAPPGPFSIGMTPVVLTVTDDEMDSATCTATVTVIKPRTPLFPPQLLLLFEEIRSGSTTTDELIERSPDWYLTLKSLGYAE